MNSKFQADSQSSGDPQLVDPEAFDASEQRFAASLEGRPAVTQRRFVPNETSAGGFSPAHTVTASDSVDSSSLKEVSLENKETPEECPEDFQHAGTHAGSWRNEVAERVSQYRRRSPREPRYPSLQLKFESSQPLWVSSPGPAEPPPATRQSVALDRQSALPAEMPESVAAPPPAIQPEKIQPENTGRLIEFPRQATGPLHGEPAYVEELAEPVENHLRIIEAPEVAPPPPALGGILIETPEVGVEERRPGFEFPLQSASLPRRVSAALVDGLAILTSLVLFGYVFFRLTHSVMPLRQVAVMGVLLSGVLWVAYQYLLVVYTGSTPGLKAARLRLSRFNGVGVPRNLRRWRVLTSALSAVSLGLGYLWCFLDEDRLCWHDRITRTHLAPTQRSQR